MKKQRIKGNQRQKNETSETVVKPKWLQLNYFLGSVITGEKNILADVKQSKKNSNPAFEFNQLHSLKKAFYVL